MAQLTIYLPDQLVREVKQRAKRAHLSVSAYLSTLVRREATPPAWPSEFLSSFGTWRGEGIDVPERLPFERRAKLK